MPFPLLKFTRVAALALLPLSFLLAHEDPSGDVHPYARIENGNFAVYFTNNTTGDDNSRAAFCVIYSPEGRLLAPRHPADPSVLENEELHFDGLTSISGTQTFIVPDYYRENFGRPYYLVRTDGHTERHKIPWPDGTDINDVNGMVASGEALWLSGCSENQQDLTLYRYLLGSLHPPQKKTIGKCAMIYDFPVASNLCVARGSCYIAWCRNQKGQCDLVLSEWNGTSDRTTDIVLAEKVDFNLSISIAVIGKHLCVAYHRSRDGDYPGKSVIATIFRTIN